MTKPKRLISLDDFYYQGAEFNALEYEKQELVDLRLKEYNWKVTRRPRYANFVLGILCFQNFFVFCLVIIGLLYYRGNDLPLIIGAVTAGVLAETYLLVRYVIQWLFAPIDYKPLLESLKQSEQ